MATTSIWQEDGGNGQAGNSSLVQLMNDEIVRVLMPVVIYISLVMAVGLIGNALVCYYYTFKESMSPNTFFIILLSVNDLITCAVSMPTDIAVISLYYTFENNLACKITRFVNHFTTLASLMTLGAIAVNRFKKICQVARPKMDMHQARRVSVIIVLGSIILGLPSLLIYGVQRVRIENDTTIAVYGHRCTWTKDLAYRGYLWAYLAAQFLGFIVWLTFLVVLYSRIWRTIYLQRKRIFERKHNGRELNKSTDTMNETLTVFTIEEGQTAIEESSNDSVSIGCVGQFELHVTSDAKAKQFLDVTRKDFETNKVNLNNDEKNDSINEEKKVSPKTECKNQTFGKGGKLDAKTVRVTTLMLIITAVFVVSFLPYLSLVAWRVLKGKHGAHFFSDAGLVAYHIGFLSYQLNCSLNPWIYGIFNSQFRRFYSGCCFRKHE